MELVRNHLEETATLEELIAEKSSLEAKLAECRANERRQRAVAKKLLQHEKEARRVHDEAFHEKVANDEQLSALYRHYLSVKWQKDNVIHGRSSNPDNTSVDQLKAEIRAAGDPWRQFKEEVFEPSRQRYLQAKQELDEAKKAEFNANEAVEALHEQSAALQTQLDRLTMQIVLRRIYYDGELPEYMQQLSAMLGIAGYADDMHVKFDVTGVSNIYFGQRDYSVHGHIAIKPNGVERYRRMPGEQRGGQNFLVYQRSGHQRRRQVVNRGMDRMLQYA